MKANLKDVVKLIGRIDGDGSITGKAQESIKIDSTLTKSGYAADAKAVGDRFVASGQYIGDGSTDRVVNTGYKGNVIMIYADASIGAAGDFAALVSPMGAMYVNGSYYADDVCGIIDGDLLRFEGGDIIIAQGSRFNIDSNTYYWYVL